LKGNKYVEKWSVYLKLESSTQQILNQNCRLSGDDKLLFAFVVSDIRKVSLPIGHLTPQYNIYVIYADNKFQ